MTALYVPQPPAPERFEPGVLAGGLSRRIASALNGLGQLAALQLPIRMGFRELSFALDDLVRHDITHLVLPGSSRSKVDVLACFEYLGSYASRSPRWLQFSWAESGDEQDFLASPAGTLEPVSVNPAIAGRYYAALTGEPPPPGAVTLDLRLGGQSLGELALYRDAPFEAEELDLLRRAYPSLVRLAANGPAEGAFRRLHVAETGLAYCGADGEVLTRSAKAVRLMRWARRSADGTHDVWTEDRPLWGELAPARSSGPRDSAREVTTNAYGRFVVERMPMHEVDGAATESIRVQRLTPKELQVFASRSFRQLSPRQRDVVLGLVRGQSHAEIAASLASTSNTVVTHVRSIYERTGAASRGELLKSLLGEAAAWERIPTPPVQARA